MFTEDSEPNTAVRMRGRHRETGQSYEFTVVFAARAEVLFAALDRSNWCTAEFDRRDGLRQVLYGSSVVDAWPTDEAPTELPRRYAAS